MLTASTQNEEDAGEYRRFMAWSDRGGVTSTRDADEAEPMGGMSIWRAGCGESRTSGSEGGLEKPIGRKTTGRSGPTPTVCRRSGMRDGSRSPAIGLQEKIANHRKRLWSRVMVVSVTEKVPERHQVWIKKTNASELPRKCRNGKTASKPGSLCCPGRSLAGTCLLARRCPA